MKVPLVSNLCFQNSKRKDNGVFIQTAKSTNSKIILESLDTSFTDEYGIREINKLIDFKRFERETKWPVSEAFGLFVNILDMRFLRPFIINYVPNHRFLSKIVKFDSIGTFHLNVNETKSILYVSLGADLNNLIKLISLCINVGVENLTIIASPTIQDGFISWVLILYQVLKFYDLSDNINYIIELDGFPKIEKTNSGIDSVNSRASTLTINFRNLECPDDEFDIILLNNSIEKHHFDWDQQRVKHLIELTDLYNP